MAAIAWPDVTALAPELGTVSIAARSILLDWANDQLAPRVFGGESSPKLKLARIYLVAHLASSVGVGGSPVAGPITSESIGGLSTSYGTSGATLPSNWASTTYGQSYAALLRTCVLARGPVVGR